MDFPMFSLPVLEELVSGGNILDIIISIFTVLFDALMTLVDYLVRFSNLLFDINDYLKNLSTSIQLGNIEGLPILQTIGAYRFLVGDNIFYLSYTLISGGCLFTLYRLCLIVFKRFRDTKTEITTTGNSVQGIKGIITSFFNK